MPNNALVVVELSMSEGATLVPTIAEVLVFEGVVSASSVVVLHWSFVSAPGGSDFSVLVGAVC
jgi:hypothetical protein